MLWENSLKTEFFCIFHRLFYTKERCWYQVLNTMTLNNFKYNCKNDFGSEQKLCKNLGFLMYIKNRLNSKHSYNRILFQVHSKCLTWTKYLRQIGQVIARKTCGIVRWIQDEVNPVDTRICRVDYALDRYGCIISRQNIVLYWRYGWGQAGTVLV